MLRRIGLRDVYAALGTVVNLATRLCSVAGDGHILDDCGSTGCG